MIEYSARQMEQAVRNRKLKLKREFYESVHNLADKFPVKDIERLIEAKLVENALDVVDEVSRPLAAAYERSVEESQDEIAESIGRRINKRINNVWANNAIDQNTMRLVREFRDDQRQLLRQVMERGVSEGINPRAQALNFRDYIGLTAKQEEMVENYRRLLETAGTSHDMANTAMDRKLHDSRFDRTIRRARRTGKTLSPKQIEKMVGRYRERFLKYRSEVIARTEALRSVHQGTESFYRQAIESGVMDKDKLKRVWFTARDERVRDSHAAMHGQERMLGESFQARGGKLEYPGDPSAPPEETIQCRCVIITRLK